MRIAVVGIGSLGCLLGGYLASVSEVTMIGSWPEQISALSTNGITVVEPDGSSTSHQVKVARYDDLPAEQDAVLVVVKSYQTGQAAQAAASSLAADGLAITFQNGSGNLAVLDDVVGPAQSTIAVTTQGATLIGPGVVLHAGEGPTHFGAREQLSPTSLARLKTVASLMNEAGLAADLADDIDTLIWAKLAVNAAINPLTALLEIPNGELLQHPGLRAIMSSAARETAAVARGLGLRLAEDEAVQQAMNVAQHTAANHSSMLQDIRRGRPTEIAAISGAVVAAGSDIGVPTPVNARLLDLVRRKEAGQVVRKLTVDVTLQALFAADTKLEE